MKYTGFVKNLPLRKGDVVKIPRGTKFASTHPQKKSGEVGRTCTITVDHVLNGYDHNAWALETQNPEVRWAGSGGYWKWVDINDIREANLALFEEREAELENV